jgi:transcriptional antiterminator NusG
MMNDLELEDQNDPPAQDPEVEASSDSIPAETPPVEEQEAVDSAVEEQTPDSVSVEEPAEAQESDPPVEEPEATAEDPEPAAEESSDPQTAEEESAVVAEEPVAAAEEDVVDPAETEEDLADAPAEVEDAVEEDEDAAAETETTFAEEDDGRGWFVVHCYSGYENKVRHNLEQRIETMGMKDRIFDVVVPTEEEIEVKDGKRKTIERRVFPGYILVQMIMTEESWYVVRNTPGVTGFVGMGNEPTALRPEEVSQIIKRMEAEAPRIKVTYKIGQKVRIIDGPFNDFIGTVDEIDMERAKVRVMVSFFGRETPVELDFLQVEKA